MVAKPRKTEAHRTKIALKGNSPGVTFPRQILETAGLSQEDRIVMEASEGRIVIAKEDSAYTRAMEAFARAKVRYRSALAKLAK